MPPPQVRMRRGARGGDGREELLLVQHLALMIGQMSVGLFCWVCAVPSGIRSTTHDGRHRRRRRAGGAGRTAAAPAATHDKRSAAAVDACDGCG